MYYIFVIFVNDDFFDIFWFLILVWISNFVFEGVGSNDFGVGKIGFGIGRIYFVFEVVVVGVDIDFIGFE